MKKLFLVGLILTIFFTSCTSKWEYKTIIFKGTEQDALATFTSKKIDISNSSLNSLGDEGWELVDVFSKIETVHPNFGNNEYVTGLQPNVRTSEISFVFKRKK
ncbi:DUF4177 domain-containing protein [Epilithonimonas hungarica]|uniref:DUF4177 domain-containing protein n=1 Tax=Epilithonimonas hungarica TaxID=454006 RepID=A0A1G7IY70_9FLAO|nr:DUF4177 domain-containing protein [Epilithonimonas hungarica]MPT33333.1 DUF4177 domain-containing protein [Chryseobacterium sp.]SDF17682.1 protein of unknown function [Epilithonimonas hungarica]